MKYRVLLLIISIAFLFSGSISTKAQTTLVAGDIAIVRMNEDSPSDGFSFVTLVAIDAGTVIYFSEEGWYGSPSWNVNSEAHLKYTATGALSAGSVVHIDENVDGTTFTISGSGGTVVYAWSTSGFNLSGGDQILAYQTSETSKPASPTFITGLTLNDGNSADEPNDPATGWTSSSATGTTGVNVSRLPNSLTNGTNSISVFPDWTVLTEKDNARFNCTLTTGTKSALLAAINNHDNWVYDDATNYATSSVCSFTVTSASPEMNVQGNGTSIGDGDASPSTSDHTDFGSVAVASGTVVRTFTIQNTGAGSLILGGTPIVAISGSSDFTVTTQPTSPVAPTSGSTTFQVTFDPSASGTRSATLSIANNDTDENPYDFYIQGVGTAPEPEIKVSGNSVEIAEGDVSPSASDYTDFGYADISSGSLTYTYTIQNQGLATLTLSGTPIVSVGGTNPADFTVIVQPSSSIAVSGSTTFQVTFNPTSTGARSATLSIANSDTDENPYNFTIQGYGTSQNLVAGDIAFIGYNSDDPDGFTFITLTNIPAYEMIYFTEEGWNGSDWSGSPDETHYSWHAPSGGLPIGSIVYIYESSANVLTASSGTMSVLLTGTSFYYDTGDQVLAYQSDSGADPALPTFIAGLHSDYNSLNYDPTTTWSTSALSSEPTLSTVPTGLTNGVNCVSLFPATTEYQNAKYNGTLTGNSNAIRTAINTYTNWIFDSATPYDISPTGYATPSITLATEINLVGNSVSIIDGDVAPSAADDTDFGSAAVVGGTVSHTFTIQNIGSLSLNLTGTPIVSIPAGDFAVTSQPSGTTIASEGSLSFTVEFNPSALGTHSATISIANNDADENPYTFAIQGMGTPAGIGTSEDPYLISNLEELNWITQNSSTWSSYFVQTSDINATSTSTWDFGNGFLPIGNSTTPFSGHYNGQGYIINNLFIRRPSTDYIGLFGRTGTVTVTNVVLTNVNITGRNYVGALIGYASSITVSNCSSSGSLYGGIDGSLNGMIGGLLGYGGGGTISNSYSSCNVTGLKRAGGFLGASNNLNINNCYATGNVLINGTYNNTYAGGFSGEFDSSVTGIVLNNSYATGSVTNSSNGGLAYAGGFSGFEGGSTVVTVRNSYCTGAVSAVNTPRGFVARVLGAPANFNCFFDTQTTGQAVAGNTGITGKTTAEMQTKSTFTDAGWDFRVETINGTNDYWDRADDKNGKYPFLSYQFPEEPEIDMLGNGISITNGDLSPSAADDTDFGSATIAGSTVSHTFTIGNTGSLALNLSGTPIVSVTAGDFTVTTQPSAATIASGASLTFTVTFNPSALGTRSATISIANDDTDENPFIFNIQGTGALPEINLIGNSQTIANGDVLPTSDDHTDFGSQTVASGDIVHTFTIENVGTSDLTLSGTSPNYVTISGSTDFAISSQPLSSTIASGANLSFEITLNPSTAGLLEATVSIANSDTDENPYTFKIQGTGTVPEINITGNSVNIPNGDDAPSLAKHTDFGSVVYDNGSTLVRTFTIENIGTSDLTLSGTPKVAIVGANSADFTVTVQPNSPIVASASITFEVTFDPSDVGNRLATISIANNDTDENPYTYDIQGIGGLANPSLQSSNIIFSNITRSSMTVRWTRGDGQGSVLLCRKQYRLTSSPLTDGIGYSATANSNYTLAAQVQENRILYYGVDENPVVNVTGLTRYQLVYFKVIEFNNDSSPFYLQDDAANNPRSRWTLRRDGLMEEDLTIDAEYPYPNPVSNSISTTLDVFENGNVSAYLYDNLGRKVADLYYQSLLFGTYELKFDLSKINSGTYQLIITIGSEAIAYPISIVR